MNRKTIFYLFIILILSACGENKFDVKIDDIQVEIDYANFEKEIFETNLDTFYSYLPHLEKKYGTFLDLFFYKIIGIGSYNNAEFIGNLHEFKNYCQNYGILEQVNKTFPNRDEIKNQLNLSFKYYKYYFPKKYIPKVYTCISAIGLSVFTTDSLIGISLDKYLGSDFFIYKELRMDNYMKIKMHKEMIVVDCMRAWCMGEFPINDSISNLLTNMIYEGRIQYFLDATLPFVTDSLKWGYTDSQYQWAKSYEQNIWDYLIDTKINEDEKPILFSDKVLDIKTFTGEAPFTTPFHNHSAPRAGTYIGYKIVQNFMENNPEITLAQLMQITDYNYIYNYSKY